MSSDQTQIPVDPAAWIRVSDLLQAYANAIDSGDIPAILQLFTPDAIWEYAPGTTRQGHEAIGLFFEERMRAFNRTSHNVGPPVVRRGSLPDSFDSTAYFQGKHLLHDGTYYCVWGRYVDLVVTSGTGLLIAKRAVVAHVTEGTQRAYTMLPRKPPPA